ncbi:MAG: hypothetical protein KDA42_02480 [Planctomycetales bacterium]|nr:hypothetical protein [Planctomycetales bacterium]
MRAQLGQRTFAPGSATSPGISNPHLQRTASGAGGNVAGGGPAANGASYGFSDMVWRT